MGYGLIEFTEDGRGCAMLCRTDHGQPTGADGVMDPLSAFLEETSPQMLRQGSPGALYMAQLFLARERDAGRGTRVVGGEGELGIAVNEVKALQESDERGWLYEVSFPRKDTRGMPSIHVRALGEPAVENGRATERA